MTNWFKETFYIYLFFFLKLDCVLMCFELEAERLLALPPTHP